MSSSLWNGVMNVGSAMARVGVRCCASFFAVRSGRYLRSSTACITRARVFSDTSGESFSTRDTVEIATPAWAATS